VSSVPRHSEEELRQQWAFLDALVDRQASSLKSGVQDPEEDDGVQAEPPVAYLEEISTLTRRVTTLEGERATLLRRIDLAEEARMAAETARATAESARAAAERALAAQRVTAPQAPVTAQAPMTTSQAPVSTPQAPVPAPPVIPARPRVTAPKKRRRSWWDRFRE
jgi:septal ring factor EnvC (AmiA/AmiB activator)